MTEDRSSPPTAAPSGERLEIRGTRPEADRRAEMRQDVRRGLGSRPKELPPKYFYDARGSRLFERITELSEYYLTRVERWILERLSPELVAETRPRVLVEFGSGSAAKTRILLDAMEEAGLLRGFAPIDVSAAALRESAERLLADYPRLRIVGQIGDFRRPRELPFEGEPRLVAFLGSTIGNLRPASAVDFLRGVGGAMDAADAFLVGFDLVKDPGRLEAAYNDRAGVTAAFNRNVLRVLNRELAAAFDLDAFVHRAFYDAERARIEMHLVSEREQTVRIGELEMEIEFERGETIRTELSYKYTRDSALEMLSAAGFVPTRWRTDPDELFAVAVVRAGERGAA